jgi:hypothetical protein
MKKARIERRFCRCLAFPSDVSSVRKVNSLSPNHGLQTHCIWRVEGMEPGRASAPREKGAKAWRSEVQRDISSGPICARKLQSCGDFSQFLEESDARRTGRSIKVSKAREAHPDESESRHRLVHPPRAFHSATRPCNPIVQGTGCTVGEQKRIKCYVPNSAIRTDFEITLIFIRICTRSGVAPSAIPIPISCVRHLTE